MVTYLAPILRYSSRLMLVCLVNHRRSPITIHHSLSIGNLFRKQKMLEDIGGIIAQSRLGEGSEERGRIQDKAAKK